MTVLAVINSKYTLKVVDGNEEVLGKIKLDLDTANCSAGIYITLDNEAEVLKFLVSFLFDERVFFVKLCKDGEYFEDFNLVSGQGILNTVDCIIENLNDNFDNAVSFKRV